MVWGLTRKIPLKFPGLPDETNTDIKLFGHLVAQRACELDASRHIPGHNVRDERFNCFGQRSHLVLGLSEVSPVEWTRLPGRSPHGGDVHRHDTLPGST